MSWYRRHPPDILHADGHFLTTGVMWVAPGFSVAVKTSLNDKRAERWVGCGAGVALRIT